MANKVSIYSLTDLKTTLDDHIPIFLTSPNLPPTSTPLPKALRLTESNWHTTVRLIIGYTSVAIALYIFYLDYYLKVPWNEHKGITLYAVAAYFLLNAALTAWIWYAERGVVFVGTRKGGSAGKDKPAVPPLQIRISSKPPKKKFEPSYRLSAEWSVAGGKTGPEKGIVEAEAPFMLFFQADGTFVSGEFERWLKKEVPVLLGAGESGAAVQSEVKRVAVENPSPSSDDEDEDVIVVEADSSTVAQSSARDAGSAKKRSRRKG